jgi:hypothetical protein
MWWCNRKPTPDVKRLRRDTSVFRRMGVGPQAHQEMQTQTSKLLTVVIAFALATSACGYALAGRGSFLPAHVQVIGVPTFTNQTPYPDLRIALPRHLQKGSLPRFRLL